MRNDHLISLWHKRRERERERVSTSSSLLDRSDEKASLSWLIDSEGDSILNAFIRSQFKGFDQLKECPGLFDVPEVDAEALNVQEELFHVDDLVPYQGLDEDTDQSHEAILKEAILRLFARLDASGNVQLQELLGQVHGGGETIDHFHGMQTHLHLHQRREILGHLIGSDQLQQTLNADQRTVLDQER